MNDEQTISDLKDALVWIRTIADNNYEHDTTLRARGARTLKRIADKVDDVLAPEDVDEGWFPISTAPYQKVIEVKNSLMETPERATRGYNTRLGVHPNNTYCSGVGFMGGLREGNLICPTMWRPIEEETAS